MAPEPARLSAALNGARDDAPAGVPGAANGRRRFVAGAAGVLGAALSVRAVGAARRVPAEAGSPRTRPIPRSGERIPLVGMGTWLTFDVGDRAPERLQRQRVLDAFFAAGGGMIDSSPMYGRAEALLGELLPRLPLQGRRAGARLFSATKVWTAFERVGPGQVAESMNLWSTQRFDLLQIHNLLNWTAHVKLLRRLKDEGRVRYIGVTTSHGNKHDDMAVALAREPWDFMQITYNLADTSAERLIETAAARGIAVIVNRPYDGGLLFNRVGTRPLPPWAVEAECANWPDFFLKWAISHPAVTCAIPATTNPQHMDENMAAGRGVLPDPSLRRRMLAFVAAL
jgi:diketogulonate reductase-like aldo/keto reductase